jgi:hypothetical protein
MAFAKALGLYWSGKVGTFKHSGDVAHYQIRTRSENDYDLLIRPKDLEKHANAVFVLVIWGGSQIQSDWLGCGDKTPSRTSMLNDTATGHWPGLCLRAICTTSQALMIYRRRHDVRRKHNRGHESITKTDKRPSHALL